MDEKCMPFKDLIRQVGSFKLDADVKEEWDTPEGQLAKILLCDQMARNVFRRQPEAYWYDEVADNAVESILKQVGGVEGVVEHFEVAAAMFIAVTLQHSENLECHKKEYAIWVSGRRRGGGEGSSVVHNSFPSLIFNPPRSRRLSILDPSQSSIHTPTSFLEPQDTMRTIKPHTAPIIAEGLKQYQSHQDVLERFGRYPHRNKLYGRATTAEEQAWLDETDKLPIWARSQYLDIEGWADIPQRTQSTKSHSHGSSRGSERAVVAAAGTDGAGDDADEKVEDGADKKKKREG